MSADSHVLEAPSTTALHDPHHARRWWILAVLGLAQLMVVLDATVVSIALPSAQRALGFSDTDRQWIVTAYSLAFGALLLLGGRIADHFGRKWVFIVGLIGFAVASAIGGAAVNFGMLVVARAVQGAFGALLAPAGLSLLTTTFTDPKERGKAFGVYGGIGGGGASLGLLLGGVLTEYASWRWTMYVNLVFAVIAVIGALALLTHSPATSRPKLDLPGTAFVTVGLLALVYGFSHAAPAHDGAPGRWGEPLTFVPLIVAAVSLSAFVFLQNRLAHPLLPLRVILDRNRGGSFLMMLIASAGMFGVFLFLTYYMAGDLHFSAVKTGLAFLPMTAAIVVTAGMATTVLLPRVSPRVLMPLGMAIAALGMALLTRIDVHSSYASHILVPLLVLAVGLGLCFAPAFALATLGVRAEDSGVASAAVNVMQQVGGAIGTALFNTIAVTVATSYANSHATTTPPSADVLAHAAVHSYVVAFWIAAAVFLGGSVIGLITLRSGKVDVAAQEHAVGLV